MKYNILSFHLVMHNYLTRPLNSCGLYSVLISVMVVSRKQSNSLKNVEDTVSAGEHSTSSQEIFLSQN